MSAYHRPTDLDEALRLLAEAPLTVAAGCTDLYPATQAQTLPGDILDITAIPSLRGIETTDSGWRLGAANTWTDILRADLPPAFTGLKRAAREVGGVQIQNAGTLAGNLCTASPAGDGAPCLLTLDARIELRSASATRTLPLQDFLTGARRTARRPDELVTAILIPAEAAQGTGDFLKLGARKYLVISIAMAAARITLEGDRTSTAALAVGACAPTAVRLSAVEDALTGVPAAEAAHRVTPDLVAPALSPIDDIRGTADYRIYAATDLIRRLLGRAAAPQEAAA